MYSVLLMECADSLTVPTSKLFSILFIEMRVIVGRKNAKITAITNKGDRAYWSCG